jgi:hypothetical protein
MFFAELRRRLAVKSCEAAETTDKALKPLALSSAATPPVIMDAS